MGLNSRFYGGWITMTHQAQGSQLEKLNQFQDELLGLFSGVFNFSKMASYLVDEQAKPICYKSVKIQPSMHREYLDHFYKTDPLHPTNFRFSAAKVVKMSDLVPAQQRASHTYFKDFIRPWKINDIIELFFHVDGKLVAGAAMFVGNNQNTMGTDDVMKLHHMHRYIEFSLNQSLSTPESMSYQAFCDQYSLTEKERLVAQFALQGMPNKAIANELCCSLPTVKTHLQHIFAKMEINSKVELTSLVYRNNCTV
ncbi:hypothetical protein CW749_03070 [Vibrio sp. vnigr-6D03]|nr:hypothetical protein CW749_03070 [Vibrio sp. vnigr-6D03]